MGLGKIVTTSEGSTLELNVLDVSTGDGALEKTPPDCGVAHAVIVSVLVSGTGVTVWQRYAMMVNLLPSEY